MQVIMCSVLICRAKGSDSPSFHPLTVDDGEDGVFSVHVVVHFSDNLELNSNEPEGSVCLPNSQPVPLHTWCSFNLLLHRFAEEVLVDDAAEVCLA